MIGADGVKLPGRTVPEIARDQDNNLGPAKVGVVQDVLLGDFHADIRPQEISPPEDLQPMGSTPIGSNNPGVMRERPDSLSETQFPGCGELSVSLITNPSDNLIFNRGFHRWEMILGEFHDENLLSAGEFAVKQNVLAVKSFLARTRVASPGNITRAVVSAFLAERRSVVGNSQKRVLNLKSALSRFCEFLVSREYLTRNPCREIRMKSPRRKAPACLEHAEIAPAIEAAKSYGVAAEVTVAIYTGLRLIELCRMEWSHIDWTARTLTVPDGKGGYSRVLPLHPVALAALQAQRNVSGNMRWVFPAYRVGRNYRKLVNKQRSRDAMIDRIRPVRELIPAFARVQSARCGRGFHLFRHSFCTELAKRNVGETKIGKWAGNPTAVRRYIHLAEAYDPDIEF